MITSSFSLSGPLHIHQFYFLPNFLHLQRFFGIRVYFLACIALVPQTQHRGSLQATWICCGVSLLVMSATGGCVLDATKIVLGITYQEG